VEHSYLVGLGNCLFPVPWCLLISAAMTIAEFSKPLLLLHRRARWARLSRVVLPALAGAGLLFCVLHQVALGSLFELSGSRLHPLWNSPFQSLLFIFSAMAAGFASVIFVNVMGTRTGGRTVGLPPRENAANGMAIFLGLFLGTRFMDLASRDSLGAIFRLPDSGGLHLPLFWIETGLFLLPLGLTLLPQKGRPERVFIASVMVIAGLITHRMNVAISALDVPSGASYLPSWTEASLTLALVTIPCVLFAVADRRLRVFPGVRVA
jgi:Ni/Fe-hydrogenase subunit HybB-like protein